MSIKQAWPFLVARGRSVGYRLVVVPALFEIADEQLLWESIGGQDMTPQGYAYCRQVPGWHAEDYIVLFHVLPAQPQDAGEDGTDLLDDYSRPISLVEGAIVRGSQLDSKVASCIMAHVRNVTRPAFREFWRTDDPREGPLVAGLLPRSFIEDGEDLRLHYLLPLILAPISAPHSTGLRPSSQSTDSIESGDLESSEYSPAPPPTSASSRRTRIRLMIIAGILLVLIVLALIGAALLLNNDPSP
jgi:hypothetical protein